MDESQSCYDIPWEKSAASPMVTSIRDALSELKSSAQPDDGNGVLGFDPSVIADHRPKTVDLGSKTKPVTVIIEHRDLRSAPENARKKQRGCKPPQISPKPSCGVRNLTKKQHAALIETAFCTKEQKRDNNEFYSTGGKKGNHRVPSYRSASYIQNQGTLQVNTNEVKERKIQELCHRRIAAEHMPLSLPNSRESSEQRIDKAQDFLAELNDIAAAKSPKSQTVFRNETSNAKLVNMLEKNVKNSIPSSSLSSSIRSRLSLDSENAAIVVNHDTEEDYDPPWDIVALRRSGRSIDRFDRRSTPPVAAMISNDDKDRLDRATQIDPLNSKRSAGKSKKDVAKKDPASETGRKDPGPGFGTRKLTMSRAAISSPTISAGAPGFARGKLSLNLGCAALNPVPSTKIDPKIPLARQTWYHGAISRAEAEVKLQKRSEGAYLVRICENRSEYALSLKSTKGFIHMKIQRNRDKLKQQPAEKLVTNYNSSFASQPIVMDIINPVKEPPTKTDSPKNAQEIGGNPDPDPKTPPGWVLGYFSQPFDTVPAMVRYYSINKLPIKGAEHMCLLYPVLEDSL